ncbi:MAG: hypothetical protein PHU33_16515 [Bacteroidales bacterium]|nr:hypothetical protein [Bacteroidales bacterium]
MEALYSTILIAIGAFLTKLVEYVFQRRKARADDRQAEVNLVDSSVENLLKSINLLTDQNNSLVTDLSNIRKQNNDLLNSLEKATRENAKLNDRILALEKKLTTLNSQYNRVMKAIESNSTANMEELANIITQIVKEAR